jgi:hypothetical protein
MRAPRRPEKNFASYVAACRPDQWENLRLAFPVQLAKQLALHEAVIARTTSEDLYAYYRQKVLGEPAKGYTALPTELRQQVGEALNVQDRNALLRTSRSEYVTHAAVVEGDRLTSMIEKSQSLTELQARLDDIIALAKEEGYRSSLLAGPIVALSERLTVAATSSEENDEISGGNDDNRADLLDDILASLLPPEPVLPPGHRVRPLVPLASGIWAWPEARRSSDWHKIMQAAGGIAADQRVDVLMMLSDRIVALPEGLARPPGANHRSLWL